MAPKRLASTAPTPLSRSKRLVQPIVEEPSELSAHEDLDKTLNTWSLREDGYCEEDDETKDDEANENGRV